MRKASTWTMAMAVVALTSLTARAGDPVEVGAAIKDQVHYAGEKFHEQIDYLTEDSPYPCFYAQVDAFILRRSLTNINFPATSLGVRGPIIAQLQDLQFVNELGPRVLAGYRCTDCLTVEGLYFGQHEWFDKFVVSDPNSRLFGVLNKFGTAQQPIFPVPPFPPTFGIGNNTSVQSGDYKTRFHNGELNAIWNLFTLNLTDDKDPHSPSFSFSLISGLRYLRMVEFFSLRTRGSKAPGIPEDPSATADYVVDCKDDAFGGQFGGRIKVVGWGGITLNVEGKFAVLANGAEQSSVAVFTFAQPIPILGALAANDGTVVTSYLGEVGANLTFDVTKHIAFRTGYDAFWLTNRALAPDQVDANATQQNFIRPMINTKGTTRFYGYTFGLEFKF